MKLLAPAQHELVDAIRYYEKERVGLGNEFRQGVWLAVERIRELPHGWSPLGGNIRRCQLRRFPYGVTYEPLESEIVIIAVAHLHRRPDYWRTHRG